MTLELDDPPIAHDTKAGYSTLCRREEHHTCARLQARCTCACHGTNGQAPPPRTTPPPPKEAPPMTTTATGFRCEPCALDFPSAQGLGAHRRHQHPKINGATPPQPVEKRPRLELPAKPAVVPERQVLAVLASAYSDLCGADVSTSIESAGELLDALVSAGWVVTER